MGFWRWESDYTTLDGEKVGDDSDSGSDLLLGLGGAVELGERLSGRLMLQRYVLDSEDIDFLSLGVVYRGLFQ